MTERPRADGGEITEEADDAADATVVFHGDEVGPVPSNGGSTSVSGKAPASLVERSTHGRMRS